MSNSTNHRDLEYRQLLDLLDAEILAARDLNALSSKLRSFAHALAQISKHGGYWDMVQAELRLVNAAACLLLAIQNDEPKYREECLQAAGNAIGDYLVLAAGGEL